MTQQEILQSLNIAKSSGVVESTVNKLDEKANYEDKILIVNSLRAIADKEYSDGNIESGNNIIAIWRKYNSKVLSTLTGLELSKYINNTIVK